MLDKNIENEFLTDIVKDKQRSTRKKAKNSKRKGNSGEAECVKILKERFPNEIFTRTFGSGNFVGGQNAKNKEILTEEQALLFAGDIRCPKDFKFTIEHKFYAKLEFYDLFNKSSSLNDWYLQSETDAKLLNKKPMLVVKTNNHKRIVFIKIEDAPSIPCVFSHCGRNCYWFEDLLKMEDSYFFDR